MEKTVAIIGNADLAKFRRWLIRDLIASGHRVVACAPAYGDLADILETMGATFIPIKLNRTAVNPGNDLCNVVRLSKILDSIKACIVLTHSTKANIIGTLAARLAHVPQIFLIIDGLGYAFASGDELRRRMLRVALGTSFRISFRACSGIFVLNKDDEQYMRQAHLVTEDQPIIKVNGTGIDLEEFDYSPPDVSGSRFLLIARFLREKGIREYCEAAKRLKSRFPATQFQLVGPFDTNPGSLSSDEITPWVQEGIIDYMGVVSDVRPLLRACTVYVLPSYREGMPRTVLEALAIGRALITTHVPGCRETVIHGYNGFLVPPRDVDALASAMQQCIEQTAMIASMGEASRRIAEHRFDVRQVNAIMMNAMGLA